jgi:hypothetical protein
MTETKKAITSSLLAKLAITQNALRAGIKSETSTSAVGQNKSKDAAALAKRVISGVASN